MSKKIYWCVAGVFDGRDVSVPGFDSRIMALDYAHRKGWTDYDAICEGSREA